MTDPGVGIIGCGLIGGKRAAVLDPGVLKICADTVSERAEALAKKHGQARATTEWRDVVRADEVEVVFVSTTNNLLAEITIAALEAGKHVLVEKPAARSTREVQRIMNVAEKTGGLVRVGFNHRYHPALLKAHELILSGELGELMFLRGRYGHGGRVGYDREWRADPELSGGGELIDQGVHLVDLSRWFMGDFPDVSGFAHTYFWSMPVDDNAFMTLKTAEEQVAFLHVSCTEWKNLFCLEIYGRDAKLQIDGLGGSYGVEKLTYYRMLPEMGPPETTCWEYPRGDKSWQLEYNEFMEDIKLGRQPAAGLRDAYAALEVVEKIYAASA